VKIEAQIVPEDALRASDPRLGRLVDAVVAKAGPQRFAPSPHSSHFEALARSIVYQQLSGKAAATIYGRVLDAVGGVLAPAPLLAASDESLRAAGLSRPKIRYVRALATAVADGEVDLDAAEALPNEAVIEALTKVQGVGVWTAQMFLMFRLGRPDVLPTGDLGIQKGLQFAHGLRRPAAPGYVKRAGSRWAPWQSLACLYLWAALDERIELADR
ncbi:MAG TPA: DNA-3-methyladenine glycosylase 2 family protein, partial [Vulgatibacter sp.]